MAVEVKIDPELQELIKKQRQYLLSQFTISLHCDLDQFIGDLGDPAFIAQCDICGEEFPLDYKMPYPLNHLIVHSNKGCRRIMTEEV